MIKLAGLFALWEAAKLFIGRTTLINEMRKKPPTSIGCFACLVELPYWAWGIWLLFTHTWPAIVIWALTFGSLVVLQKRPRYVDLFGRFDSVICFVLLTMLAIGRI